MVAKPTDREDARRLPIVRDTTFVRAVADSAVVIDLGRDIELAFLQVGPNPTVRVRKGKGDSLEEGFELEPVLTEVARVRISSPPAFVMAMHIIQIMVEEDRIHTGPFLESIQGLVAAANAAKKDAQGEKE